MAYSVPYICHAHGACAALDRRSIHRELIDRSIFVVLVYQPTVGAIECKKTESGSVGSERGAPLRIAPLSIVCVHSASLASKKRSGFSLPTTSPTFVRHRDSQHLLSPRQPPPLARVCAPASASRLPVVRPSLQPRPTSTALRLGLMWASGSFSRLLFMPSRGATAKPRRFFASDRLREATSSSAATP